MKKIVNNKKKYFEWFAVCCILGFCEWLFFRNVLGNGALIGDRGDGRLTMLLTEHWWNFFRGQEKFSEIAMFYPVEEAFGYTDLFLGYGILHSVLRMLGLNVFYSYKYTLIILHVIGVISMYYLLKNKLKINTYWSLFGTMAFCFSDSYARHLGHTQLNAISYLPILLILFISFIENYKNVSRDIYAYCCLAWFILLTYTSWYIACFTGIFGLIFLVVYFICLKKKQINILTDLKQILSLMWKDIIGYVLFTIILYIPFIQIYIPVLKASSGYSYGTCAEFLPEFIDIINVSEQNLMLGWLIKKFKLTVRGYSTEVEIGFSIVLLLAFTAMFILHKRNTKISNENHFSRDQIYHNELINAVFISIIVGIVLIIRLSSNGISLWIIFYYLVPVAKSVRAIARFLLWLSFPMTVVTAYSADRYIKFRKKEKLISSLFSIVLLFMSNINMVGVSSAWHYSSENEFIKNITAPPKDAEIFYITDTDKSGDPPYIYQLDAFEIATKYSLKTLNGYSGQSPKDWDGIWNVCSENYERSIYYWIKKYNLNDVYAYDRAQNIWIPFEERKADLIQDVFSPVDNKFSLSSGLMDHTQGEFVWTNQNFETNISNSKIKESGLILKLNTQLHNYLLQSSDLEPKLQLFVDGNYIQDIPVIDGYAEYVIPMNDHESDNYTIELKTNCYFNPKDIGINSDTRNLSIALHYIGS